MGSVFFFEHSSRRPLIKPLSCPPGGLVVKQTGWEPSSFLGILHRKQLKELIPNQSAGLKFSSVRIQLLGKEARRQGG